MLINSWRCENFEGWGHQNTRISRGYTKIFKAAIRKLLLCLMYIWLLGWECVFYDKQLLALSVQWNLVHPSVAMYLPSKFTCLKWMWPQNPLTAICKSESQGFLWYCSCLQAWGKQQLQRVLPSRASQRPVPFYLEIFSERCQTYSVVTSRLTQHIIWSKHLPVWWNCELVSCSSG